MHFRIRQQFSSWNTSDVMDHYLVNMTASQSTSGKCTRSQVNGRYMEEHLWFITCTDPAQSATGFSIRCLNLICPNLYSQPTEKRKHFHMVLFMLKSRVLSTVYSRSSGRPALTLGALVKNFTWGKMNSAFHLQLLPGTDFFFPQEYN